MTFTTSMAFRRMFTAIMTCLLLALTAQAALAQQGGRGAMGGGMAAMMGDPEERIKQLITALEVTAEQEPKFREVMGAINAEQAAAIQAMIASGGMPDRQAMMQAREERQKNAEKLLAEVLTEAQLAKYREQEASRMGRMGGGAGMRGGAGNR